jgi:beta-lactamase superfamily II metal-dependent hydrolase
MKHEVPAIEIRIGSWWAAADGGEYGCVVVAVDVGRKEATVLGTDGVTREIDTFKLQYRYYHAVPNKQKDKQ